jgi:nicotinate-nucleotide--dimethylbenzimidazole phosphoribosyltransferase
LIDEMAALIGAPDGDAMRRARALQLTLTKPAGALGRLEDLHVWAAGVFAGASPALRHRVIVVAAADHGVAREGVSAYPPGVTAQMARNFLAGGAAVNALARQAGAEVIVVDTGIASHVPDPRLRIEKVRAGTDSMTAGPAMARPEAIALIERGAALAMDIAVEGPVAIALGDMGIGNTTAAAAITSVITQAPPRATAGRGTGIDDAAFAAKVDAIERAIALNQPHPADGIDIVSKVGGCEIAFLAGVALGAASARAAVLLDGYPSSAAALIAASLAPAATDFMLASHVSAEPGHRIALAHLALDPLLDLGMRLGEGTGAALALMLLDAALALPREMATFRSAGVQQSTREIRDER